jgi:capsular exopolysaccharide synthesis family protein
MNALPRAFYGLTLRVVETLRSRAGTVDGRPRGSVVLLTSARPGEGKSVVARALASIAARIDGQRVLLVDGNVRRPSVHAVFGIPPAAVGFSDCLATDRPEDTVLYRSNVPRLDVMAIGQGAQPELLFQSAGFRRFADFYRQAYELIVIDADTLDATGCLAHQSDGVVLVVDASGTRREVVQGVIEQSNIERARFLGAVLNKREHHIPGPIYRAF